MKGKHKLKASKAETTKTTETVDYTKMSKKKIGAENGILTISDTIGKKRINTNLLVLTNSENNTNQH